MKHTYFLTAFISLILTATAHGTGGMTSSGGDHHDFASESAWFLGSESVSYCIEIAPGETISRDKVNQDFRSAVKIWRDYYEERAPGLHEEGHRLNFNFSLEACAPGTRLKILIGTDSEAIRAEKSKYQSPWGFVHRTEFDMQSGMGRGYIWFAPSSRHLGGFPEWSFGSVFHGGILHEIGHVFGTGHTDHTIMDKDLISKFQMAGSNDPNWARYGTMYMTQIDHHYILLFHERARLKIDGYLHLDSEESKKRFEKLAGRSPQGKIRTKIETLDGKLFFTLADDLQSSVFEIPLINRTSFDLGGQVFYAARDFKGYSTSSSGKIFLSSLRTLNGEVLLVEVAINANHLGWPVRIRYMDIEGMKDIFNSDLWLTAGLPR